MKRSVLVSEVTLGIMLFALMAHAQRGGSPFPNGITPLWEPESVDASKVTFLDDQDIVIGVTGEGVAKAYPGPATAWHHIVQDRLGKVPILATW
jgi:hypothetical protein